MKHFKSLLCFLLLNSLGITILGQNAILATGGNATGSNGSVSYSIGQITNSTFYGTNGTVAQGVQQPYEISVATSINNIKELTLDCTVYPNPTRGMVKLLIESFDYKNLRYQLYDANGVLLQDKKIKYKETEIVMDYLTSSIYFLKIIYNNSEAKVFKIVKR